MPFPGLLPPSQHGLPTANLAWHFDFSDTSTLFVTAGSPPSTTPGDGDPIGQATRVAGSGRTENLSWVTTDTARPLLRSVTPLMNRTCADFDGTNDNLRIFTAGLGATVDFIGTTPPTNCDVLGSAHTLIVSFYVESTASNSANPWQNEPVFMDSGSFMGLHIKANAGAPLLQFYGWDTNADVVNLSISTGTSYVAMYRVDGTNIYGSINGGAESSATHGATSNSANVLQIGGGITFFNGRIGEIAAWNAALTGATLTQAINYFTGRWI